MDDATFAAKLWTTGFGNMQERFSGQGHTARPAERALRTDWRLLPMPLERTEIELKIPLTEGDLDVLSLGHIPEVMEDHWFMYFDGEALCFHRSWTGICIYQVHVRHADEGGYELSSVTVNRDTGQYDAESDTYDRLVSVALVVEALGKDASALWQEAFALDDTSRPQPDVAAPLGFWHEYEPLGYLSNWHASGFEFGGKTYASAEHWIMWQKARVMGDNAIAAKILEARSPQGAKALGGKVKPYDDHLWRDVREQLAYVGIREKFLQNPELARELLATGDAVLAEASPYDHTWGVGIRDSDKGFADFTGWKGENLQGRICMRVRADLALARSVCPQSLENWPEQTVEEEYLLGSSLGSASLVALARNPLTRPSALTYARIAQHQAHSSFHSPHQFLLQAGQTSLRDIEAHLSAGSASPFTNVGWKELLAELCFLKRVNML